MKKEFNKYDYIIIVLALFLITSYYLLNHMKMKYKDAYYNEKMSASILMQEAITAIKEEKIQKGISIDKNIDINETGIIGIEYSTMTTTLGSLESKRTSANPSFAAVVVHMMKELGLVKGDYVAINLSGSFPGLNIAVMCASQVLELNPIVMASAGASTYGANIPEFNYICMEEVLYNKGILSAKSVMNSLGGDKDIGADIDEDTKAMLLDQITLYNRTLLFEDDLGINIMKRYETYQALSNENIKCFINVGGNLASIGSRGDWNTIGCGILKPGTNKAITDSGLIGKFISQGVPVINLLNVKKLAVEYNLPIDPYPIPHIGDNDVFFTYKYPKSFAMLIIIFAIAAIYLYGRRVRDAYDKKVKN